MREPKPGDPWEMVVARLKLRIEALEDEFGHKGVVRFMTRGQLENKAVENDTCPACGHRRTKDG